MRRTTILLAALAAALSAAMVGAPAQAVPQVVGIADPDGRTFATASRSEAFVRMVPRENSALQRWSVELDSTTVGTRVVNAGTGGCLGVSLLTPTPEGAPVTQERCRNEPNELWRVARTSTEPTVRFVHVRSGLCLTVEAVSPGIHAQLRLNRCANLRAQQFRLVPGV